MRNETYQKSVWTFVSIFLFLFIRSVAYSAHPLKRKLTIVEILEMAERVSPDLKAGYARENQAKAGEGIAQSTLYPHFHFSVVDSWGFPGSSIPVPSQFGGLIASPFRVGVGGGVIGKMTLLDLRNWRGVEASQAQTTSAQERNRVIKTQVDRAALAAFFEAIRYRGHQKVWIGIRDKINAILKTMKKRIKTGQYADVQRLLIQDQFEEADLKQATFEGRYKGTLQRLAILTQLDESTVETPFPEELTEEDLRVFPFTQQSPFLTHAEAETQVARAKVLQFKAEHLPKVYALGSLGLLEGARFVNKDNYSAWIGVALPLFEGLRVTSEVRRAQAMAVEKENDLASAQLGLSELNAKLDEDIGVARLQLKLLKNQHQVAITAFQQAKDRFLSFLSPVVDLREAVRDLARIEIEANDAKMDLLIAVSSHSLVNGASISKN